MLCAVYNDISACGLHRNKCAHCFSTGLYVCLQQTFFSHIRTYLLEQECHSINLHLMMQ